MLRDADRMSFAQIEKQIRAFAKKADDGSLSLADLKGGTFTITNGGVFGSLMSTPILNIVDGAEAVRFLVGVKQLVEDPGALLLD